jgi:MFS family permease
MHDLVAPLRDPVLVGFLAACLATFLVFSQAGSTFPLEMGRHGIGPEQYGRLMAINGLLIVALQLGAVKVVRRLAPPVAMAISSLLIGTGFGLNVWAGGALGYAMGIVVWTCGEIAQSPVASSLVADLAPVSRRGAYQGAFAWMFAIASCLAPLIGGAALQRLGAGWLWGGCFALGLAAALGHLSLGPMQRRRLAEMSADCEPRGATSVASA